MGILSGKYSDDEGPDAEWQRWLDENGGKMFVDSDAAYAEIRRRQAMKLEREYHTPLLGSLAGDDEPPRHDPHLYSTQKRNENG